MPIPKRQMLVLIDKQVKMKFKETCIRHDLYMSDVVQILIERWLDEKE